MPPSTSSASRRHLILAALALPFVDGCAQISSRNPDAPADVAVISVPVPSRLSLTIDRHPDTTSSIERALMSRLRATAGIVAPIGGDLTGDAYLFVPPPLGGERSLRPGVQARVAYTTGEASAPRLLDIGLSGHAGWERRGDDLVVRWPDAEVAGPAPALRVGP